MRKLIGALLAITFCAYVCASNISCNTAYADPPTDIFADPEEFPPLDIYADPGPQFEYLQLKRSGKGYIDSRYPVKIPEELMKYMNTLGSVGWELVTAEGGFYIFKRRK